MKAARLTGPRRFEFLDMDVPVAQDGQCLIRLERLSICGSDIRHTFGRVLPEEDYPLPVGRPCHEIAGVVVESRNDEFREGQRVIVLPTATPGMGGLVEYLASYPDRMVALPDHGDLTEWVMCQHSGTVLFSCRKMGSLLGKSVLIVGQGGIGLSFSMLTSMMGARQVIAIDLLDYRLEYSKKMGATHTINPSRDNVDEAVKEITGGAGADITVEAAGYTGTLDMALRLVRVLGTVMIFGVQGEDIVPVNTMHWMIKQPTLICTSSTRAGDPISPIRDLVDLKARGVVDPGKLITHHMTFNEQDVNRAHQIYEHQQDNMIKVVLSVPH